MTLYDRMMAKLAGLGKGSRLHVADPRFDSWDTVREFGDLDTALAWRDRLREAGFQAELTSDWELDRFRRGDIRLEVPPGTWSDAEAMLENLDLE